MKKKITEGTPHREVPISKEMKRMLSETDIFIGNGAAHIFTGQWDKVVEDKRKKEKIFSNPVVLHK